MRLYHFIGVVLIVVGVFVLWKRPTFSTSQEVVRIGDFKASVDEVKPIPLWWGVVGIGAGVVVLLAAGRRRGTGAES
jgi:hypothetical protein